MRRQFESNPLVLRFFLVKSSKRVLGMVCDNLSKYFPIVMNFSGYLPLYEDTSAIDFEPDRSSSQCEWDRNFKRCYRYALLNNLVLAVP